MEDLLAQEKAERSRHHESVNERVDSLQRTLNIFDSLIRKEMEERTKENRRLWDAVDNHTHDLSTQVISDGTRKEVPELMAEPPGPRILQATSAPPIYTTVASPQAGSALLPTGPTTATTFMQQQQSQPSLLDSVVRVSQQTVAPVLPSAAVRVPSPMTEARMRAHEIRVPSPLRTTSFTNMVSGCMRPVGPPSPHCLTQESEPHVERVTCGHTRYFGERHRAAEIIMD